MRTLFIFNMVTVDGFFEGLDHDINWHHVDEEFNTFAMKQLEEIDTLLFGRNTYQLMASYWPTQQAKDDDPQVAKLMNDTQKLVFSSTLANVTWENTTLIKGDIAKEIGNLKQQEGKSIAVFGSGQLTSTLLQLHLIDEIRLMVNPIILGSGTPLFAHLHERYMLQLTNTRTFQSGNVLLRYHIMY